MKTNNEMFENALRDLQKSGLTSLEEINTTCLITIANMLCRLVDTLNEHNTNRKDTE